MEGMVSRVKRGARKFGKLASTYLVNMQLLRSTIHYRCSRPELFWLALGKFRVVRPHCHQSFAVGRFY